MKGFIIVTGKDELRTCIALKSIATIDEQSDGKAYITNKYIKSSAKKPITLGMDTLETFEEVIAMIENATN
ncbi:MAG: hypothetical protein ACI4MS_04160 [Candidatus Coproplasma sp.]